MLSVKLKGDLFYPPMAWPESPFFYVQPKSKVRSPKKGHFNVKWWMLNFKL
jgi:hypothetical protein